MPRHYVGMCVQVCVCVCVCARHIWRSYLILTNVLTRCLDPVLARDAITRGCWWIRLMQKHRGRQDLSVRRENCWVPHCEWGNSRPEASELSYLLFWQCFTFCCRHEMAIAPTLEGLSFYFNLSKGRSLFH